ncbi:bifunctional DNA primase/polymerase [Streptomyces albus subsp. chlorinus]|uniref:bifunctional DNA primase/polymerase n=1 Tax=Streptomyces albus TaxID=1888 RepID=UPI001D424B90|nr:bifunctional DNA primase/polymerase [Streptomyces albus]NSC25741.1 bifunctional DNA primase/polymerase [Streptomyces albus subsp. chlorinus]
MLTVARECAAAGWPVHPLTPGRKTPVRNCPACQDRTHQPTACPCIRDGGWCHGFHAATTDQDRIRSWWSELPRAGVGVSCGPAHLVVIDIDAHPQPLPARDRLWPGIPLHDHVDLTGLENGFHTLAVLAALRSAPDPALDETTLRVRTPSGGLHVWYQADPAHAFHCSSGSSAGRALCWQVDVRAHGGYIVAPGTRTTDGTYTRLTPAPPAPLPEWLARELVRTGHTTQLDEPPSPSPRGVARQPVPSRAREAVARAGGGRAAAAKALETVLAEVAGCAAAAANMGFSEKLNRAAYTAGGLIAAGHLDQRAAEQALQAAADHARPRQHHRAAQIIRAGLTAGAQRPMHPGARS